MRFRKSVASIITLAGCLTAAAFAQTASTTYTRTSGFPPVGLGSTETAQINVLNTAAATSSGTAASCTGTVSFATSTGTAIGTATPFTIGSGQVFSANLPFSKITTSGSRVVIVGSVQLTQSGSTHVPCSLVSSLETYDTSSGVTHIHLTGSEFTGGSGPFGR